MFLPLLPVHEPALIYVLCANAGNRKRLKKTKESWIIRSKKVHIPESR